VRSILLKIKNRLFSSFSLSKKKGGQATFQKLPVPFFQNNSQEISNLLEKLRIFMIFDEQTPALTVT